MREMRCVFYLIGLLWCDAEWRRETVQLKAALSTLEADLEDLEESVRCVSGLYDYLLAQII